MPPVGKSRWFVPPPPAVLHAPRPGPDHHAENTAIVRRHLEGDPRAFGELVRRYQRRLQTFIFRMIGDRERAEDLVQEAFIRIHRHIHRFDQSKKFSTWVYTIASNLAKNELRNRSRSPLVYYQSARAPGEEDQRPLQFEDRGKRPDEVFAHRHVRELIDAAVAQLSEHHRQVFVLRELEGRSYEEIALITGTNLGTVKSRLNRARASFAEAIGPFLD
ncbi:MAG: sigma-70 family RNA polymerase sigma factor [Gemmatimonadales bacterium]|nr:sigma-70 family RNA polymerase sigma factor [Gemmatimonadales bacterium]